MQLGSALRAHFQLIQNVIQVDFSVQFHVPRNFFVAHIKFRCAQKIDEMTA